MKLPNIGKARIDRTKIVDYLLAVDHPEGAGKATFFLRFGFTIDDWQTFADALISHAQLCHVTKLSESEFWNQISNRWSSFLSRWTFASHTVGLDR